jgi:hypothetical protein
MCCGENSSVTTAQHSERYHIPAALLAPPSTIRATSHCFVALPFVTLRFPDLLLHYLQDFFSF